MPESESVFEQIRDLIMQEGFSSALSDLGVFGRNLKDGRGFSNYLWKSWGYTDAEMTEEKWMEVLHPSDREKAAENYRKVISGEIDSYRQTYRIRTKAGEWRWVVTGGTVVTWNAAGDPEIFLGSDTDITDRIRAEEALAAAKSDAEAKAQEAETLRTAGAIVASTLDIDRTVQMVLDQAARVVPYDTATVQLLREDELEVIGGSGWEDQGAITGLRIPHPGENPHSRALASTNPTVVDDLADSFPRFSNISGTEIRSWMGVPLIAHGETLGLLAFDSPKPGFFTPKHARLAAALGDHVAVALHNARLYEQTRELAMTDSLTGVATRRSFFVQAEHALEQARRSGRPVSVLMADLDHLKKINDAFGHAAGDAAIRSVSDAARLVFRRADILGRYGGEEFAVVLPDTSEDDAYAIAERLRASIESIPVAGREEPLSVSVGLSSADPRSVESVDQILDFADRGLYEAKRKGRNRVEVYRGE